MNTVNIPMLHNRKARKYTANVLLRKGFEVRVLGAAPIAEDANGKYDASKASAAVMRLQVRVLPSA